jgi:hypothetical protein
VTARRPVAARRRLLLLRAGLALAGLAGVVPLAGCSADTSAPSLADVRALLDRHAAAVRQHDHAAFAADLDTAAPAAGFRAAQLAAFGNLERLPLRSWSYRVESRTNDREAERAATRHFGTPAIIVQIALRYALRGVDRIPTAHDVWWTFVRHDGRVVVAADNGLQNAGGVSWRGPWDFGRLDVLRGPHSLVLGHPQFAAALRQVRDAVEAAVPAVTAVWGPAWSQDVAAVVPASQQELTAQTGQSSDVTTQVAAVAVSDGQDPVSGTVYGQRLLVNPGALARLSPLGRRIVIRHEITHIASAGATTAASPQWLVEGFADYVGNLGNPQPVRVIAGELRADVRRGKLPTALPAGDQFATDGQSAQAYEGAWLACRLIARTAGQPGLVRFYRMVGAAAADQDAAVAAALHSVLHETTAQFTARWRAYLRAELG